MKSDLSIALAAGWEKLVAVAGWVMGMVSPFFLVSALVFDDARGVEGVLCCGSEAAKLSIEALTGPEEVAGAFADFCGVEGVDSTN